MAAGHVTGDGKAKAGAAMVLVAGVIEPVEGAEHGLAFFLRQAWAIILNPNDQPVVLPVCAHLYG